jgi:hypothetical protein
VLDPLSPDNSPTLFGDQQTIRYDKRDIEAYRMFVSFLPLRECIQTVSGEFEASPRVFRRYISEIGVAPVEGLKVAFGTVLLTIRCRS